MLTIGITGQYGSGKSKITRIFNQNGFKIIDLDKIGHKVLKASNIKKSLIKKFGHSIIVNKEIDRKTLRNIVFSNYSNLQKLNKTIHPKLIKLLKLEIKKYKNKKCKFLIIEAALLFELKCEKLIDIIITVSTLKIISYIRILFNKKIPYKEFNKIYNSQMNLKIKKQRSDYIINNNFNIIFLKQQVLKLISYFKKKYNENNL